MYTVTTNPGELVTVTTLDEVRQVAIRAVWDAANGYLTTEDFNADLKQAGTLSESGGTIKLPDGTIIEIRNQPTPQ